MSFGRRGESILLYVLHSGNWYGTERMAWTTLAGLVEYPVRALLAPPPDRPAHGSALDAARAAGHGAVVFHSKWQLIKALVGCFARYRRVDLIGNGVAQSRLCRWLSLLFNVRLRQLHIVHGGAEDHYAYARIFRLNGVPLRVIAVSEFVESKLVQYGVAPGLIDVICNYVSEVDLRSAVRRPPYLETWRILPRDGVRVVIASRIDAMKRIDVLVEALERENLDGFTFDVYGTGGDLDALRTRTAGQPNIRFHGYVDDAPRRLASADLLLHLCPVEPFGLAILEGFVAGVVVLVPDTGGAADLVSDGVNGLRFRANDASDLARRLREAATFDARRLQSMADAARYAVSTRFSEKRGLDSYRESFGKLGPASC